MTSSFADIEIGQLRLRSRGDATSETALRLRVDHLLGSADIQPAGMSPSAVLIVRYMADPLPGRLAPHESRVRVDRGWEQATRSALAGAWQTAARPTGGVVPDGVGAVLFDDEASLLAQLAVDVCVGRVHERWWWQALPRSVVPPLGRLDQIFLRQPRLIPAIVHHLAMLDRLADVVAALSPSRAATVVAAMLSAYGMTVPFSRSVVAQTQLASELPHDIYAIWDTWTPPRLVISDAGRERQCLVGLGLGLFHAPSVMRSGAFQQQLQVWWAASASRDERHVAADVTEPASDTPARSSPSADVSTPMLRSSERQLSQPSGAVNVAAVSDGGELARREPLDVNEPDGKMAITPVESSPAPLDCRHDISRDAYDAALVEVDASTAGKSFVSDTDVDPYRDLIPVIDQLELDGSGATAERDDEQVGLAIAGGFRTELGGFAYLINLMCRLDLPDCFEDDWRLATTVGPWGTLELLARALAGSSAASDLLWPALAQLAGRPEGTLPGLELVRPEQSRLPEDWPVPDADAVAFVASPLAAGLSSTAVEWFRLVVPVVRHFIGQWLEDDDPGMELLCQSGQVYISSTHVDVVLPLDAISIPIRIAGLDRDPGWLPDFGRVVKIHFT